MNFRILHYVVELVSVILIAFITVFYMTVGGYEPTLIGAAIGAITGIAAWDIHKRADQQK